MFKEIENKFKKIQNPSTHNITIINYLVFSLPHLSSLYLCVCVFICFYIARIIIYMQFLYSFPFTIYNYIKCCYIASRYKMKETYRLVKKRAKSYQ